jgi:cell division protein FtsN
VGWHIVLRLGWPHLVVAGVFVVMLMYASFAIGRRSAAPPAVQKDDLAPILTPGPTEPLAKTPPAPSPGRGSSTVVTPQTRPAPLPPAAAAGAARAAEKQPPAAKTPAPAHTFAEGSYYVVVQYFSSARKKDADEARDFLAGKGVSCVVHQGPARDWWLVATEQFSSAQQAQRLVARVRDLGKEYFTIGRYDFRDPVARKF